MCGWARVRAKVRRLGRVGLHGLGVGLGLGLGGGYIVMGHQILEVTGEAPFRIVLFIVMLVADSVHLITPHHQRM